MKNIRLPRKVKKLFKNKMLEEWEKFLEEKRAFKEREEHINTVFTRNYKDSKKIFNKMMKHGK